MMTADTSFDFESIGTWLVSNSVVSRQCADGACCVGPFLKGGPRLVKLVPVLSVSRPGAARGATCKTVGPPVTSAFDGARACRYVEQLKASTARTGLSSVCKLSTFCPARGPRATRYVQEAAQPRVYPHGQLGTGV